MQSYYYLGRLYIVVFNSTKNIIIYLGQILFNLCMYYFSVQDFFKFFDCRLELDRTQNIKNFKLQNSNMTDWNLNSIKPRFHHQNWTLDLQLELHQKASNGWAYLCLARNNNPNSCPNRKKPNSKPLSIFVYQNKTK